MVGWIVGKLKWLLVVCAVGGPILALSCWQDGNRRQSVMAEGLQADATIDSATRVKRRRGGTTYKLDLSWTDAGGARRAVEDVSISHDLARRLIVGNELTESSVAIKYMTGEAASPGADGAVRENVIILSDTAHQEKTDQEMIYAGAGAGALGVIGSALMFLPRLRRRDQAAA